MPDVVLAVDLGGTNMRVAAVSDDGRIHHIVRSKTPAGVSPPQLLDLTEDLASQCRSAIDNPSDVKAIGFASPAPAAQNGDGILSRLPNLPSLNGMPLGAELKRRLSMPVVLENDATAAAIGEFWLGASKSVRTSVMITLGTGVGGGLIINGEPYRGIDGTAGEIGHTCVEPYGHPCGCGSRGCIEQYASARAVVRMAHEKGLELNNSFDIYTLAKTGDQRAIGVYTDLGTYLGITLASVINILNPEMIVIGGGMAKGWDAFIKPLKEEINARAFEAPAKRVAIVRSQLGGNAGLLGVARSAFQSIS